MSVDLSWVLEHGPVIAGLIVAVVVANYTRATTKLTAQLAEAQLNPYVIAVLEANKDSGNNLDFVVRNAGNNPARNIRIETRFQHGSTISNPIEAYMRTVAFLREEISFLGPTQELRVDIGSSTELQLLKISVDVTYYRQLSGVKAKRFHDCFELEADVLLGSTRPEYIRNS